MKYILSQHNVLHKLKYIHPITDEAFCKCDYHGYFYDNTLNFENQRKCKKCFR
jgi:hypothetical protein